tara:strand:+ start:20474 stop:21904 length:1431 start_codon:yes stop_codon:yes gene_type:complete
MGGLFTLHDLSFAWFHVYTPTERILMNIMTSRERPISTISLVLLAAVCCPALGHAQEGIELVAAERIPGDVFGVSVAISGTTLIVGAGEDNGSGNDTGCAYLFDSSTGTELFRLTASVVSEGGKFGASVGVSGTTAIVGAAGNSELGHRFGAAYLFDTTTGEQLFKLTALDGDVRDQFGSSVSISGNLAIVGSIADDDRGLNSGSAYIFDVTTGQQLLKLTASDGAEGDYFGNTVFLSGSTAIVGAYRNDERGTDSGAAYLFDVTTGEELFKLVASDAAVEDWFGRSVSISGTTAIVGAERDDDSGTSSGSAYLFDSITGQEIFKLTASDASSFKNFGHGVSISGRTAVITTPDAGTYFFDTMTGEELFKLNLPAHGFGYSAAISDRSVIVGAADPGDDDGGDPDLFGSAFLFNDIVDLPACPADLTGEGDLNFLDVSAFLSAFGNQDPVADFEADGSFNFLDVSAFLAAFGAGCP